jgi:hypothetical protein
VTFVKSDLGTAPAIKPSLLWFFYFSIEERLDDPTFFIRKLNQVLCCGNLVLFGHVMFFGHSF